MKHTGQITREFVKLAIEQDEFSREFWPFSKESFETLTLRHLMRWLTQGNDVKIAPFDLKEIEFLSAFAGESQLRPGSFVYRSLSDQWPREATDIPLPVGSLGFTSWTTDPIVSKNKLMQGDKTMLRAPLPESNWLDTVLIIQKLKTMLPIREGWAGIFTFDPETPVLYPHPEEKEVMIFQPVRVDVISPLKV
jgi:hypothetical protein